MSADHAGCGEVCECGRPLEEWNRQLRFRLPEPVLGLSAAERAERTWGGDVLMQVQGVGAFVRCLLPVQLTGGYSVTYGLWLAVHPDELRRTFAVWDAPEYQNLVLDGWLGNVVEPWGRDLLGASARAVVRDSEQVPYIVHSDDPLLGRILNERWKHEDVLAALP